MKWRFVVAALLVTATVGADDLVMRTGTYGESPDDWWGTPPRVSWWGNAVYVNDQGGPGVGVWASGNLSLFDVNSNRIENRQWGTINGWWEGGGTRDVSWDNCYSTAINGFAIREYPAVYGNTTCFPVPPGPPGGGGTDDENACVLSPLVIAVDFSPYWFSNLEGGVRFDLNVDGIAERTAWTSPGTTVGFLAMDLNGNDKIDDGSELFGNRTGHGSFENGFDALALLDSNMDGRVDQSDIRWSQLVLWIDANHNGLSESDEIRNLGEHGITALDSDYRWIGRRDQYGNLLRYRGFWYPESGGRKAYFDVFVQTAP